MADSTAGPRFEERPTTSLPELQRATAEYTRRVKQAAMGYVLKDVTIAAGNNAVAHGLGAVPSTFFVMLHTGGSSFQPPSRSAVSTALQIFFYSDVPGSCDILVIP